MRYLSFLSGVAVFFLFGHSPPAWGQHISDWYMHEGRGVLNLNFCSKRHGDVAEYQLARIPKWPGPGWKKAPNPKIIGMARYSALCNSPILNCQCGRGPYCRCGVDFTYFRNQVWIPKNYKLTKFEIELRGMDDGTRVTVFNSKYPNGIVPPGAYVFLGGTLTQDIKAYIVPGEYNAIVLTHVDDCCRESNLREAYIRVNGRRVSGCKPSPEKCNGRDDDCDGQVDESWPNLNKKCQVGIGGCISTGVWRCKPDGSGITCTAKPRGPTKEVCNGQDDDCDGKIDENVQKPCNTNCGTGIQVCNRGKWGPCSAPQPKPETCNGKDDDCDGKIDDGLTKKCQTPCGTGTQTCAKGKWGPCSAPQPKPETCNGKDDDCDGKIDEGIPPRPCKNSCGSGTSHCRGGKWSQCQGIKPKPELCNGKDDDCNGVIDDGLTRPCKTKCGAGREVCLNGAWVACNAPPERREICDGRDNDCDGQVDNGKDLCPSGMVCRKGECLTPCRNGECPVGFSCRDGICHPKGSDPCAKIKCGAGHICKSGRCIPKCYAVACKKGLICKDGRCVEDNCYGKGCPKGYICLDGKCVSDPCMGVVCSDGQFCFQGKCVNSCASVRCGRGERCIDGKCVKTGDSKCAGVTCPPGKRCVSGICTPDPCYKIECPFGKKCRDGVCRHDPCLNIKCSRGQICRDGQCFRADSGGRENVGSDDPPPAAEPAENDGGITAPDLGEETSPPDADGDELTETGIKVGSQKKIPPASKSKRYGASGCNCLAGGELPSSIIFLLFLALFYRRRNKIKS